MGKTFDPTTKIYDVTIEYCVPCDYSKDAIAVAQEILEARQNDLKSLTLVTGTGGVFEVTVNDQKLFSKKETKRKPEPGEIAEAFEKFAGAPASA